MVVIILIDQSPIIKLKILKSSEDRPYFLPFSVSQITTAFMLSIFEVWFNGFLTSIFLWFIIPKIVLQCFLILELVHFSHQSSCSYILGFSFNHLPLRDARNLHCHLLIQLKVVLYYGEDILQNSAVVVWYFYQECMFMRI